MKSFMKITGVLAIGAMVALGGCASEVDDTAMADGHSEHDGHDHSDHDHDHAAETASAPPP